MVIKTGFIPRVAFTIGNVDIYWYAIIITFAIIVGFIWAKVNNGKYKKEYDGYYYQVKYNFDIKKMKNASKLLIGTHDYHNFVSGYRDDYTSTIYNIKIKKHGDIIVFKFVGIGFYRYMIRHLVGALLDVGRGKVDIHIIENMLDKDIDKKLSVVPADGLYLEKIWY